MKIIFKLQFLIISLLLLSSNIKAQKPIQLNLGISPQYPLLFDEYLNFEFNIVMTMTNQGTMPVEFYLSASLISNSGVSIITDPESIGPEPIILAAGETRDYQGDEFAELYLEFNESDIMITGSTSDIFTSRALPEGIYTLCINAHAYTPSSLPGEELSEPAPLGCAEFEIIHPDRPVITYPIDDEEIASNAADAINFAWLAPGTVDPDVLLNSRYTLKVIDITTYNGMSPTEAMLDPTVDYIFLETDIEGNTLSPEDIDLIEGHQYAVRVSVYDDEGLIEYQSDGHSDVVTFSYGDPSDAEFINLDPPQLFAPDDGIILDVELISEFQWTPPAWDASSVNPNVRYKIGVVEKNSLLPIVNEYNVEDIDFTFFTTDYGLALDQPSSLEFNTDGDPFYFIEGKEYHACIFVDMPETPFVPAFEDEGFGNCIQFNYGEPTEYFSVPVITSPIAESSLPVDEVITINWNPSNIGETIQSLHEYKIGIKEVTPETPEINYSNIYDQNLTWFSSGLELPEGHTNSLEILIGQYNFIEGKEYAICPSVSYPPQASQNYNLTPFIDEGIGKCVRVYYGEPEEKLTAPSLISPSEGATYTENEIINFKWNKSNFEEFGVDASHRYNLGVIRKTDEISSISLSDLNNPSFYWTRTDFKNDSSMEDQMDSYNVETYAGEYFVCIHLNYKYSPSPGFPSMENSGFGGCRLIKVVAEPEEGDDIITPPVITIPEQNGVVIHTGNDHFQWDVLKINGGAPSDVLSALVFIDETENNLEPITTLEVFKSHSDKQAALGFENSTSSWTVGDFDKVAAQMGLNLLLKDGHKYAVLVKCRRKDQGIEHDQFSQVVNFTYSGLTPPEIIKPENNASFVKANKPNFTWTLPQEDGLPVGDVKSILSFIDLTKHNIASITTRAEWISNQDKQSVVGIDNARTEWNIDDNNVVKSGLELNFINGHKYVVNLICPIGEQQAKYAIRSDYVTFSIESDESITTDCSDGVNFTFDPYYPLQNDTIPFKQFPIIAQYDPVCTDVNRLGFDFNVKASENSSNFYNRTNVMNRWPTGPIQYLKDIGIDDAEALRASLMPLNLQSEQTPGSDSGDSETSDGNLTISQGTSYTYKVPSPTAKMRYSSPTLEDWFEGGFSDVNFNVGMPMPKLQSPVHEAKVLPGKVQLKWNTGNVPERLITPLALVHAKHQDITELTYFSEIDEHYVIQVAKENTFTDADIIFGDQGKIEYNGHVEGANSNPTSSTYFFNTNAIQNAVYKDVQHETDEITEEGDYFWRVLWLNTGDGSSDISDPKLANLIDQAYRVSPTRKFSIDKDAEGGGTPLTKPVNQITNCTTPAEITGLDMTAAPITSGLTSFTAGYFSVTELDISNTSGNSISGKGIIKIDFMNNVLVKVEFENIKLNSSGQLVDGVVKAQQEDTPFNLNDINSSISSGAETLGLDGQVNTWLEENADEGRIVSAFVADRPLGMPIGIERDIKEHKLLIGITALTLNPTGSTVKLLYEQHFEKMRTDQWLSIAGEVFIKPSGFEAEVLLHLNGNIVIEDYWEEDEDARDIKYIIKGNSSNNPTEIREKSTYIEFKCACVENFALRMEAEFDQDKLVKDTDSGEPGEGPVKAYFNFELKREKACLDDDEKDNLPAEVAEHIRTNNFMVDFTMDPFQLKGLEGWGFHVTEGYLDFSSLENPEGMVFPEGYAHGAITASEKQSDLINIWSGFYLKEISMRAPADFYKNNAGRQLKAGVQNLFIDNTGFSGEIFAENIVAFGDGEVDDCSFSIDSFRLRIIQNVFREGELEGKFGIPITDEDTDYEAVLAYTVPSNDNSADSSTEGSNSPDFISLGDEDATPDSEWGFFMGIKPSGKLSTPAFMGNITLKNNSYVHIKYGEVPESFVNDREYDDEMNGLSLYFDGVMDFTTSSSETALKTDTASVNTPFNFKGMQFDLAYSSKKGFDWNHSFASPQKYMGGSWTGDDDEEGISGFPLTIRELEVESDFNELATKCIGAKLKFNIALNLMDDDDGGFEANVDLKIGAKFDFDRNRFLFDGLHVGCIEIGAKTAGEEGTENSGITFKGKVCFYNDETYCGVNNVTGIAGQLTIGLPIATVQLGAMFASTDGYRFWYVDGKAVSSTGSIVTLGPIDLIGLSGGIYYNMRLDNVGEQNSEGFNGDLVKSANSIHDTSPSNDDCMTLSGFRAIPHEGSYIFKVGVAIATKGDASVFNMDVGVTAAITRGQGLTYFDIVGDGYVMADIDERAEAPIKADIKILFDKQLDRKIFDASFAVYLDLEMSVLSLKGTTPNIEAFDYPVTGKKRSRFVRAAFHLEAPEIGDNTWSFKLGRPTEPGGLSADILDLLTINIRTYFQIGSDIDVGFMALPKLISDLLDVPSEGDGANGLQGGQSLTEVEDSDRSFGNSGSPATAQGFILGLSADTEIDISVFIIYAHLQLALGFDVNVIKYGGNSVCYTGAGEVIDPMGSNGWYASGQLYAGILGEVGLQIWFFGLKRFHLFKLGAAFLVRGGFPNPVWAEGRAAVMYSVLGGLVEGSANISFTVGEKCVPPKVDPFGFSIIAGTDPGNDAKNVNPFVRPKVSFTIPVEEVFEIPAFEDILDEDGKIVDTRVYTEKIEPYIEKLEVRDKATGGLVAMDTRSWSLNDDNTILTANISAPQENKNLSLFIKLAARELKNGKWEKVLWPPHAQKEGYWSEDTTIVFTTTELPEQIDERLLKDANPFPNQRYYLKDALLSKNGKIEFFRNLRSSYFKDIVDGKAVEYFAKFYSMDGSDPFIVPIRSYSKSISFTIPPALQNDMIYNLVIVRKIKEEAAANTLANNNNPLALNSFLSHLNNNNNNTISLQQQNVVLSYDEAFTDAVFAGLNTKTNFISNTRKLIPGESELNPNETIIFKFPFKTSQFNSLQEKLANAESLLTWRETGSGEFSSVDPWVQLRTEEGFDRFDMYGVSTSFGDDSYERLPLIAFYPDLDNYYWSNTAKPAYESMLSYLKHGFFPYQAERDHPDVGHYRILSDLRKPRISWMGGGGIHLDYNNLKPLLQQNEMQMGFHMQNINKPKISRFKTIDPRTVFPLLSQEDVQYAWDNTVSQMAEEMYPDNIQNEDNSSIASASNEVFYSGISTAPSNGIISMGSPLGGATTGIQDVTISSKRVTRFLYDFNRRVEQDMAAFKARMVTMHYFSASFDYFPPGSSFGSIVQIGNVQREHIKDQFSNYNAMYHYWLNQIPNRFNLENNPGNYKFNVNYYMIELNGNSIPAWGSPDIPLNFSN